MVIPYQYFGTTYRPRLEGPRSQSVLHSSSMKTNRLFLFSDIMQRPYLLTNAGFYLSGWLAWRQEEQRLRLLQFSADSVHFIVFRCISFEIVTVNILFRRRRCLNISFQCVRLTLNSHLPQLKNVIETVCAGSHI